MSASDLNNQPPQAVLNRIWAMLILEELTRFGVQHVCVGPGSRSTPLTLEADENPKLTLHTHFDERGLGFLALGMAKATHSAVAIVVTSGTAVANLLPAIAEAKLTGEKLVVLTADRPVELIDCGANQVISQSGIFSDHVTACLNLPGPGSRIAPAWLLSSVDKIMYQQRREGSAVHINCPYPEPLYSELDKRDFVDYFIEIKSWLDGEQIYSRRSELHHATPELISEPGSYKGLIVIGKVALAEAQKAKALAEALGWPVLCDPQSGISGDWYCYDLWLREEKAKEKLGCCNIIVQFGARLVSKTLAQFIRQQCSDGDKDGDKARYYLVGIENQRLNPDNLPQIQLRYAISDWVDNQLATVTNSRYYGWADELKVLAKQVKAASLQSQSLSELSLAAAVPAIVDKRDLFIGNSLVVRLLDMVAALRGNRTYSNRGASGIEGLIATAAGVQKMSQQPIVVLLGDTSLLYDLNSLALFTDATVPSVILVTNNDGGAIFNLLPVPREKKRALYQMPHGYQFKYAAKQFGLDYLKPDSIDELLRVTTTHLQSGEGALLVEVVTAAEQAGEEIKELISKTHAICKTAS